jgi:hypothetical protein
MSESKVARPIIEGAGTPSEEDEDWHRYETAFMRFQAHLTRAEDGTFQLDVKDGESIGVNDPVLFEEMKRSLDETNRMIRQGEIDPKQVEWVNYR